MTSSFLKTGLAALLSLGGLLHGAPAASQTTPFPSQPIKLIVSAPPGGESDAVGRLVADGLQSRLKVSVIVDNKPGAGVGVGSSFVARAAPDGYTVMLAGSGLTASPAILKTASDPVKDFTPISQIMSLEFYLAVRTDSKVKTLPEMVALAKTQSDKLNYGSAGLGSITHFQMEMLKSMAGFDATHVPFKGSAASMTSLLAGDIQMMFVGTPAIPHFRSNSLRPIAVAMPNRSKDFPDVPTIEEFYPGFDAVGWTGLVGPAHLPAEIVQKLNTAMVAVVADPGFAAKIKAMGGQVRSSTPEAMGERLKSETARYGALGTSLGIQPQ